MQLKLNIYKGGQVEKTYEAGEFDMEIFPELTDEEMKRVKIKELVPLVKDIVKFSIGELSFATGDKGKN